MRRGLRAAAWTTAVTLLAGCVDVPPGIPDETDVDISDAMLAGVWVGHVSGATYTFAADRTFTAAGVPTVTFAEGGDFVTTGPRGPYHCVGSWHISSSLHFVVLDVADIRDEHDGRPFGGPRSVTLEALTITAKPQWPLVLRTGPDWLTRR